MPEIVWNPLGRRWVAIAPSRSVRPGAGGQIRDSQASASGPDPDPSCPFCPGNEAMTPPETWALRPGAGAADTSGWQVRAVPNLYPAVEGPGMRHEVLIHSPSHLRSLDALGPDELERLATGWLARIDSALAEPESKYAQISVNSGRLAGASLPHPHSQVVALSFLPREGEAESAAFATDCPICSITGECAGTTAANESGKGSGGVGLLAFESDGWLALVPPWAEYKYELLLAPRYHVPRFGSGSSGDVRIAAEMAGEAARRLDALSPGAPYNMVLHTQPGEAADFHWHLHLYPRLTTFAGIELGAGLGVTTLDPEAAAADYRSAGLGGPR